MKVQQLRLMPIQRVTVQAYEQSSDPVQRVFAEWLFWFRRSPGRCKLGPSRRSAINAALTLYDEDLLRLCWIGAAADEWLAEHDHLGPEWILGNESRIEKYVSAGEAVQLRALREQQAGPTVVTDVPAPETPEQIAAHAAARERLRAMAHRHSGRGVADE